jgi:NAD+ synthase
MTKEERVRMLVDWIQDRVRSAGCRGVVFAMSGGIDSSLLAVLCKKAFPQNALGMIMPCYSADEDKDHAEAVARKFEISTKTAALNAVYDSLLYVLPDFKPDADTMRIAKANIKSRLRMLTLYYVSNQMKYLVAGSGNRSELTIGYFTKHGDGGVDILPLGNLVKKEVIELARYLDIPREIIDKPPSAGLWLGQTDEGEIGFTYEALDRYLLRGTAPEELKSRIEFMKAACLHKITTTPIPDF